MNQRYFTLPFTKKGLDVFGDTLEYILGIKSDHDKKTRINAICEDNIKIVFYTQLQVGS